MHSKHANSLAWQCSYTNEVLQFIQLRSNPALMHSNKAKLRSALLVTANTPMRFCTSYSSGVTQL